MAYLLGSLAPAVAAASPAPDYGLYPAASFRLVTGQCRDCAASRQALWYFRAETIAVPRPGIAVASFTPATETFADVRAWAAARTPDAAIDYPPLVWVAASQVMRGARMSADGGALRAGDATLAARPIAKIPLNRSYYDASSVAWLQGRDLAVRGETRDGAFVMRSVWPNDFRVGPQAAPMRAMPQAASAQLALRALVREAPRGGAQSPYAIQTLWQREGAMQDWTGKPVLALLVNGAQGDDDEAHAGHFALVTGRVRGDGAIGDWLADNFYSLDIESEKGILAAPVPLDNYLADLNSGQSWYRPTYLLVMVLRDERAPALVQSALNRVYQQFYRHQLVYYHPADNCASISVDTLRALGWPVRARGPTNRALAWVGFPFVALKERSFAKARVAVDYLYTDQTRLLPAAALEEAYADLADFARGTLPAGAGALARMVAEDLEALAFVRVPQFPSSRAFGDAPVVSMAEYRARVPADPALAQIVPVPPRAFPDSLRDPDLLAPRRRPSDYVATAWGLVSIVGIPVLAWRAWRAWRRRQRKSRAALE
ncbi:MAG: hypothetical protein IT518_00655 [Burkholderiales bacterium]|nr:hypothetical protein [Burkholderiales bacterium]